MTRPAQPHVRTIHAFLRGLADHGFGGAPSPLGLGPDGQEELTFLPGDVPVMPYPEWSLSDEALTSVALLLRRFHDAARAVMIDPALTWPTALADPQGGPFVCHNDVCLENVVFRDGEAVGLIDFDLAAPGRPIWDLVMTARYWVPMVPPEQSVASGRDHLDRAARLRLLVEAYGLPRDEWTSVIPVLQRANQVARQFVADLIADGNEAMRQAHEQLGGWQRWEQVDKWVADFNWI